MTKETYGIEELITNNNIAENSRHILNAIGTSTASILAADAVGVVSVLNNNNLTSTATQKAISDTSVATQKAIGDTAVSTQKQISDTGTSVIKNVTDSAVAGINTTTLTSVASQKAISDTATSVTKAVTDGTVSGLNTTTISAIATQKAISDAALSSTLSFGTVNTLIGTVGTANAIAAKDIQISLAQDGAITRAAEASHFAQLQLDIYKTSESVTKEILKGFAETQYKALENKASLEAKIAECCCEARLGEKTTQALIISTDNKRVEAEANALRMELLVQKHHRP